jgi:uncharacterized membrane protein YjjP (DUF1212 family)
MARGPRTTLEHVIGGTPPPPDRELPLDELAEYLMDVGNTLSRYGCPSHRAESVVRLIAQLEGCECEVFAVPTGLWLSVRRGEGPPAIRLSRVKEWRLDLDRLTEVDRIFNEVIDRTLTLAQARQAIDAVEARPRPYPAALTWLAAGVATGAAAVFFGGNAIEVAVVVMGGWLVQLASRLLRYRPEAHLLENFIGGLIAAGLAMGATIAVPHLSREVLILSVVIALVPGMALTTSLAELTNKSLLSGAARLMDAMMSLFSIVFGIAVVIALEKALGPGARPAGTIPPREAFDWPVHVLAMAGAALAFTVLFGVPRRYVLWSMLAGLMGWLVTWQAKGSLTPSLGAFAGATCVTLYANLCARVTRRPAQVFQVPGMVLLVPGSFGFLSLEAFLRGELLGGATRGFEMFMIAGAIVTGTVLANVVLPARKVL